MQLDLPLDLLGPFRLSGQVENQSGVKPAQLGTQEPTMTIDHHPVKTCGQVGHIINVSFTVRCLHREEVWHSERTYRDGEEEQLLMLVDELLEFGPFDSPDEIACAIQELQDSGLDALQGFTATP